MNLCENLQRLRRQAGLSQEALAEKLGVSRQAVSKWESGAAVPELDKLTELAHIFHIRLDELLGLPSSEHSPGVSPLPENTAGTVPESPDTDKNLRDILAASRAQTAAHYKKLLSAVGLAMAAMLLIVTLLITVRMNRWARDYQNELSRLQGAISALQVQISSLSAVQQENSTLFLDSDVRLIDLDVDNRSATLRLTVTLREFSAAPSSPPRFVLSGQDWSDAAEAVRGMGNDFSADIEVPLLDAIEASFVFTTDDGTERVEPVDTLHNLDSITQLVIWSTFDGSYSRFNLEDRLTFHVTPRAELVVRAEKFFLNSDIQPPVPQSGYAELTRNGNVLARTELTFSDVRPDDVETAGEQAAAAVSGDSLQYTAEGGLIDCECPYASGDHIVLTLFITDSYGQEHEQTLIDLSIGEDGDLIESAP